MAVTRTWKTRPEIPEDRAGVRRVNLAAFPGPAEADLVDALRDDPAWLPGLSWVAETPGGDIAGYGLLTRCQVGDAPALALAPMAVLPAHQRQGAGGAIVRSLLDAARRHGERMVVVLGHPEYYPRFGFTPASGYGIRASFDPPDEALMALPLSGAAPPPQGTIRYAAPFGV